MNYAYIAHNLALIQQQIAQLTSAQAVQLVAVSKTFPIAAVTAAAACGQRHFGENYPQELASKAEQLANLNLIWHFIGNLQSNKTKLIARYASWVHTLANLNHAERLNNQRPAELAPLQVLLEVKISPETTKHGLTSFSQIEELATAIKRLPRLQLRGLMGMAAANASEQQLRQQFQQLKDYLHQLQQQGFAVDQLSMGMSHDFDIALECGATMVRIGSKIFGVRDGN